MESTTTTEQGSDRAGGLTRAGGWGAITFVVIVILQNVLRGTVAPQNDATAADVVQYYADHRGLEVLLTALFVISGIGLALFLGAVMSRLAGGAHRSWAFTGFAGAIGVIALFSTVVGIESALVAVSRGAEPSLAGADALWALHNGVFSVLELSLAIALLGLGRAGAGEGMTPPAFSWIAPVGGGLLAIGAAASPLLADGSAMPLMGLALVGFLAWLVFLLTTGIRLVHPARL